MAQIRDAIGRLRSVLVIEPTAAFLAAAAAAPSADALLVDEAALRHAAGVDAVARLRGEGTGGPRLLVRTAHRLDRWGDIEAVMALRPDAIVLTPCPDAAAIQRLGVALGVEEARLGLADGAVAIVAGCSEARGLLGLAGIAGASARLSAVLWDADGLAEDCGARGGAFAEGTAAAIVRTLVRLGAAAAGVPCFDAPSRLEGEALAQACAGAVDLGYCGKLARDPAQIAVIDAAFARGCP